jgi:hypothetical protein
MAAPPLPRPACSPGMHMHNLPACTAECRTESNCAPVPVRRRCAAPAPRRLPSPGAARRTGSPGPAGGSRRTALRRPAAACLLKVLSGGLLHSALQMLLMPPRWGGLHPTLSCNCCCVAQRICRLLRAPLRLHRLLGGALQLLWLPRRLPSRHTAGCAPGSTVHMLEDRQRETAQQACSARHGHAVTRYGLTARSQTPEGV